MKKEKPKKLTEKQKRFIDFYIETGNATKACKMAGYKGSNLKNVANQNLTKLHFLIQSKLTQKESERIATQDEILHYLTAVMRGEEVEEVVTTEATGEGYSTARIIEKKVTPKDRLKAAEMLAKRHGLLTPKNGEQKETLEKLGEILEQTKLNAQKKNDD